MVAPRPEGDPPKSLPPAEDPREARDPDAAQQSINNHLAFVEETLQESSRFESRSQRSLRRRNLMA